MSALKYSNTDDTNGLLLNDLANGFTVYAFDLTVDAQLNDRHRRFLLGHLRLQLGLENNKPHIIILVFSPVYDSAIEITQLLSLIHI